jgi:predicted dinucleotide-binding enzyme
MKYAIVGAGKIGTALARAFAKGFVSSLLFLLTILIGAASR